MQTQAQAQAQVTVTVDTTEVAVEEGATARVVITASPPPAQPLTVNFEVGADDDPDTPDASGSDYNAPADVVVGAGEAAATIEITITDDDLVEPPREAFRVTLLSGDGYEIGEPTTARVAIKEGVCDRTPKIQERITGHSGVADQCAEVTDAHLRLLTGAFDLTTAGDLSDGLKAGDFDGLVNVTALEIANQGELNHFERGALSGLTGVETVTLSNNAGLTELPGHLFEGLGTTLRTVLIYENSNLTGLSETLFHPVPGLTKLQLHTNALTHLAPDLFKGLTNLNLGGEELDLTKSDQGLRLGRNAGITEFPAGIFSDLTGLESLSLERLSVPSLPRGIFRGLDNLRVLSLWDVRRKGGAPLELVRGTFEGLGSLEVLNLGDNGLRDLPSGVFSALENLGHLRLQSNSFETLPAGIFLGLENLYRVSGDPHSDDREFTLRPQFRHVADLSPGVFTARLTLREGAPFEMPVTLSTSNGAVSTDVVTLFRGTTQSEVFTVTQAGGPRVEVTMDVDNPPGKVTIGGKQKCSSDCFTRLRTNEGSPLVSDAIGPRLTGVAFRSTPATGDAYSTRAGETVLIAVRFDEAVVVQNGTPSLTLDVGGTLRDAVYAPELSAPLNTPAELVFRYRPALDHRDNDGIGFAADALDLNGASLADSSGNAAETALTAYAVANDPGHKVAGLVLGLRFEPDNLILLTSQSAEAELILDGTALLPSGEEVTVTFTTDPMADSMMDPPFTVSPSSLTLSASHPATMVTIEAGSGEGDAVLEARISPVANARLLPARLAVRVTRPVITITTPEISAAEGSTAEITAGINPAPAQEFSVRLSFVELPAEAFPASLADIGSIAPVTISAGQAAATFAVPITDDGLIEPTREVFDVVIVAEPSVFTIGGRNTARVTIKEGVCDRTQKIRERITGHSGVPNQCADVSDEHLGLLTGAFDLTASGDLPDGLKAGDFGGLVNVAGLTIRNQGAALSRFPRGALAGLTGVETVTLRNNSGLTELPGHLFEGLGTALRIVLIYENSNLTTLSETLFHPVPGLTRLQLNENALTHLAPDLFRGLVNLNLGGASLTADETNQGLNLEGNNLGGLPAGVFSDLGSLEALELRDNRVKTLPSGVFRGLDSLRNLGLWNVAVPNQPLDVQAGAFDGLGNLEFLQFGGNGLTTLPPGVFSDLGNLGHLRLQNNNFDTLPAGIFSGLGNLHKVSGNPNADGREFTLRPQFQHVADTGPGTFTARLTLREGAPFEMPVTLSTSNGTVSTDVVTLFRGATQSEVFTVTQTGLPPVELTMSVGNRPDRVFIGGKERCSSDCFVKLLTAAGSSLVLDKLGPRPVGVAFRSAPAVGDAYSARSRETISVVVSFDEAVVVQNGTPLLTFDVGGTPRDAVYVPELSTPAGLVFSRQLASDDRDDDGIGFTADALKPNGASLTDSSGNAASTALDAYAVVNDPGHKVTGLILRLRFEPDELALLPDRSGAVELTADGVQLLAPGEEVAVTFTTDPVMSPLFTASPPSPPLSAAHPTTMVTIGAGSQKGTAVLQAQGAGPANVQVIPASLTVRVSSAVITIATPEAAAEEGATARVVFAASPAPPSPVTVNFSVGADLDPDTPDASGSDYRVFGNVLDAGVVIGAGEAAATIEITITDDDLIEPPREAFRVTLLSGDGYEIGEPATARVTIREGVCDRTPKIQERITGHSGVADQCAEVTDAHLGLLTGAFDLTTAGDLSDGLKAGDFDGLVNVTALEIANQGELNRFPRGALSGLTGVETVTLRNNAGLTELPGHLFEGLGTTLRMVLIYENSNLTTLSETLFHPVPGLTKLQLHTNALTHLAPDLFKGLTNLNLGGAELDLTKSDQGLRLGRNAGITEFPAGIFSDLTGLESLSLERLSVPSLPRGIFRGLDNLRVLSLWDVRRKGGAPLELVRGTFEGLGSLEVLNLGDNGLRDLPSGVFSALENLGHLRLQSNSFETLPAGIFLGLENLYRVSGDPHSDDREFTLRPQFRHVADLSPGVFTARLTLREGAPFEMPIMISVSGGTAPGSVTLFRGTTQSEVFTVTQAGDPPVTLTMDVPNPPGSVTIGSEKKCSSDCFTRLRTADGSAYLSDGISRSLVMMVTTEVTVVEGATARIVITASPPPARPLTVNYRTGVDDDADTPDASNLDYDAPGSVVVGAGEAAATIEITITDDDLVESLLEEVFEVALSPHADYDLGAVTTATVAVREGVCDRTQPIQHEVVRVVAGAESCADVTGEDLAGFSGELNLSNTNISSLKPGDFTGFTELRVLNLGSNQLQELSAGAFDGLGKMDELKLQNNRLSTLAASVFAGLGSLRILRLSENRLAELPADLLDGLGALRTVELNKNALTELPDDFFAGRERLTSLILGGNDLTVTGLPDAVFFGLRNLQNLAIDDNELTGLPEGAFSGYGELISLRLHLNRLSALPAGIFSDLKKLSWLSLSGNALAELPAGVFSGRHKLTRLNLHDNELATLPADVFTGLGGLAVLSLGGNPGAPFELALGLEFGRPAGAGADRGTTLRVTLREGAPYRLEFGLQAAGGELSAGQATIPAGTTRSATFSVTRAADASSVAVSFAEPSAAPGGCVHWQRVGGRCFSGFTIGFSARFFSGDAAPEAGVVSVISSPVEGGAYEAGSGEEIVVGVEFGAEVAVAPAADGGLPSLLLEIGAATRTAVYDASLSSTNRLAFRYAPVRGDWDDDGVSVRADALKLNGARIVYIADSTTDPQVDLSSARNDPDNDGYAARNAAGHRVESPGHALRFEPAALLLAPGSSVAVELSVGDAQLLPAGEEIAVTFATDPMTDPPFTASPERPTLSAANPTMTVAIEVAETRGEGSGTLEAQGAPAAAARLLPARLTVRVTLPVITVTTTEVAVTEGATAEITVGIHPPPGRSFDLFYANRIVPEASLDPGTSAASLADLGAGDRVTIQPGQTAATLAVMIVDDDLVEPTREAFDVVLSANPAIFTLGGQSSARVTIHEGVCDRTEAVWQRIIDEYDEEGLSDCADLTDEILRELVFFNDVLDFPSSFYSLPSTLKAGDFRGLSKVRKLDIRRQSGLRYFEPGALEGLDNVDTIELFDNDGLTELPGHLFEGLGTTLRTVWIHDNPNLTTLSETLFQPVPALTRLILQGNGLTHLAPNLFEGLTRLRLGGRDYDINIADSNGLDLAGNNIADLTAGGFSGLSNLEGMRLMDNPIGILPPGAFTGLGNLRALFLGNIRAPGKALDVRAGAFEGLGSLEYLSLGNNGLTTLPAGVFSALTSLGELRLHDNRFNTLPAGMFTGLVNLHKVTGDIHGSRFFTLTPEFQLASIGSAGVSDVRLTLREGAPFDMPITISVAGGTAPGSVTLFRGTTQSEVFTVTQAGGPRVELTMGVEPPPTSVTIGEEKKCASGCFERLRTANGALFASDAVGPRLTGVAFRSTPASGGDAYSARSRETVSVVVSFDEAVVIQGGPPSLTLDVGGTPREAVYVPELSTPGGLVFSRQLASDDRADDGIGFAADALNLNGASLADSSGNAAETALDAYAVANNPGHKVVALILGLRFEPDELMLQRGRSARTRLILESAEALNAGEAVAVTIPPSASFGASFDAPPGSPSLSRASPAATVTISVPFDAALGTETVEASGAPNLPLGGAQVVPGRLAVSVLRREVEVLFSPERLTLLRGGVAPATAAKTVTIETRPELRAGEIIALELSAPAGLELSPSAVTLSSVNRTAAVKVTADADAGHESVVSAATTADTRLGETAVRLGEATVLARRGVNLLFDWAGSPTTPLSIPVGSSAMITVTAAPPLEGNERINLRPDLSAGLDAGLRPYHSGGISLSSAESGIDTWLTATAAGVSGRFGFTVSENQVHVASPPFSLDVETTIHRVVSLEFVPPVVRVAPGRSADFTVTTVPPLNLGQSAEVRLTAQGGLGGVQPGFHVGSVATRVVALSQANPSGIVTLSAPAAATIGATGRIMVDPGLSVLNEVAFQPPLPVLEVEVTPPQVSVTFDPPELDLEVGVARDIVVGIGRDELLAGQSAELMVNADAVAGLGLTVEPETVLLTADQPTMTMTVTASHDGVEGTAPIEAVRGAALAAPASFRVKVRRVIRLRFDPPEVTIVAGESTDVFVSLDKTMGLGDEGVNVSNNAHRLPGIRFPALNLTRTDSGGRFTLEVARDRPPGRVVLEISVDSVEAQDFPGLRFISAELPITVLPRMHRVVFDPPSVVLVRGGAATGTASTDVQIKIVPAPVGDEALAVEMIPIAGFGVSEKVVTIGAGSRSRSTIAVSAGARTGGEGFVFLRERQSTHLDNVRIELGRLEARALRGVELTLAWENREADAAPVVVGESASFTLSTAPPPAPGERVTARLRSPDGAFVVGRETIVLDDARPQASFSAMPQTPGVTGRIVASGVGQGVAVVAQAALDVATANAERTLLEFDPPGVRIARETSTEVRITTRPLLGPGQSLSATLIVESGNPESGEAPSGVTLGALGARTHEIELSGGTTPSEVVTVSAPPWARAGSVASVAVVPASVSPAGVGLEEPFPTLAVEVSAPRAAVSLIPAEDADRAAGALRLTAGETGRVSVGVQSSVTAVLAVEVVGEGLTVSPPRVVLAPGAPPATVEVSAAVADVAGVLSVSDVGGADLTGATTLPVRVANRLLFTPDSVRVKTWESAEVGLRLESMRSLAAGEQVEVDISGLDTPGTRWSPSVVTFSAARPTATARVMVPSHVTGGTFLPELDAPVPAFESGRLAGGPFAVEVVDRSFEVVFEPDRLTIVRDGLAPTTVSALATVKTVPVLRASPTATDLSLRRETVGVNLRFAFAGPHDSVSPTNVVLTPENPAAQIEITAASVSGRYVASSGDPAKTNVFVAGHGDVLNVDFARGAALRFAATPPSAMTAGETTRLTVTTEPPLAGDESVVLRLDAGDALRFEPQSATISASAPAVEFDVTAVAPVVMERLTVSGTDTNVVLAGGDLTASVTVGQAATVSATFSQSSVLVGQNRSTTVVSVEADPALGSGQSVAVTVTPESPVIVTPREFVLDETNASQQLEISAPSSATIGAEYAVRLAASGTGVDAEVPGELTVTVEWPRVSIELSHPDGLVLRESANVTLTVAAGDLVGSQTVAFELYIPQEDSLDVRSEDRSGPYLVSFSAERRVTAVTVTANERARSGVLGELRVLPLTFPETLQGLLRENVRMPIRVFSVSVGEASVSAAEGETADVVVRVTPAPGVPLRVGYTVGAPPGAPPDTADASDYRIVSGSGEMAGELIIPAGETRAVVPAEIADDEEIEPPREQLSIRLAESLSYFVAKASSVTLVLINEGVCDRTPQVRDAITAAVSAGSCADVTAADLDSPGPVGLEINDAGLTGLKAGDFSGLTPLRSLSLDRNLLSSLPPGTFAGLGSLRGLSLSGNRLSSLPPGIFAGLAELNTLALSGNHFADLPAGVFVGLAGDGLDALNMLENRGSPFTLTLEPRRLNSPPAHPAEFRLVVGPGAPFNMEVGLSALEGAVSPERLMIPVGSTESDVFRITLDQDSSRAEVVFDEEPQLPSSCSLPPCYRGVEVAVHTGVENAEGTPTLVLDGAAPELTGVEILSMPAGETHSGDGREADVVYDSGETVVVALRFSEEIVALPEPGLLGLKLRIGSEDRIATYDAALSATDTLVFRYRVADGDRGVNGIEIRADALMLNGAQIRDYSGLVLDPSLGTLRRFPDHKVLQLFSVVLDPPTVEVVPGRTTTFAVTTRPPLRDVNRSVRFFIRLDGAEDLGLEFAPLAFGAVDVALAGGSASRVLVASVSAAPSATIGAAITLDYLSASPGSGIPFVQQGGDARLRLPPPRLSVTVVTPKATVAFSPADELFLTPGAAGEVRVGFAAADAPPTPAVLSVEADGGFSVSASEIRLSADALSTVVTVTAPPASAASSATGTLKVRALRTVELRKAAQLPLRSGRGFTLSFEPVSLTLAAGETTEVRVSLGGESDDAPPLAEDEVVYVEFTPDPGLGLSAPSVLLDASRLSVTLPVKALLSAPAGESSVTAQVSQAQARYLAGRFDDSMLSVRRLLREIRLLFEPGAVVLERESNMREASTAVRVMTDKPLLESEVVAVQLVIRDRDGQAVSLSDARVTPSSIDLREGSGAQEITVFSRTRNIARVQMQTLGRTEVGHAMLHLGHLDVAFKAGVRLRIRVFLEGALE